MAVDQLAELAWGTERAREMEWGGGLPDGRDLPLGSGVEGRSCHSPAGLLRLSDEMPETDQLTR